MKYITLILRILTGALFIFSGIIKANDPLGFGYKLEEYFVEFGMDWDWLLSIKTFLASARIESNRIESSRIESHRIERNRTEPNRIESNRIETIRIQHEFNEP